MNLGVYKQLLKRFGPMWLLKRAYTSGSQRLGVLKRKLPSQPWSEIEPELADGYDSKISGCELLERKRQEGVRFLFDSDVLTQSWACFDVNPSWAEEAQQKIFAGTFSYFSARWVEHGDRPDWFLNPYTDQSAPSEGHFSQINEFGYGDVKAVWELSRFSFVYDLVRAFARTGDSKCAEEFWRLVEDWIEHNPPYEGINWKCGQESSFRLLAVLFGFWAFAGDESSTAPRVEKLYRLILATAIRVEKHIGYAINQKNNHGISEGVLLWTVGVLFPEFRAAERWKKLGQKTIIQLCRELIYNDGGFSQSSANYHRLVIHLLSWLFRLAQRNEIELEAGLTDRFQKLVHCLGSFVDPETGRVPRFGNDDGACLLPLTHCEYDDFRPAIQLAQTILERRAYKAGKWDEALQWFGFDENVEVEDQPTPVSQQSGVQSFQQAGCHILKLQGNQIFVRAGKYRHRPGQTDATHVDLSWNGIPVAIDPGIYSYNGPEHWQSLPFHHASSHNTVTVDGKEPTQRISKFMFLPWQESEHVATFQQENIVAAEFKQTLDFGLTTPVTHRRSVALVAGGVFIIVDGLESQEEHNYRINWLLSCNQVQANDDRLELELKSGDRFSAALHSNGTNSPLSIIEASEGSSEGWFAPRYLELEPAVAIQLNSRGANRKFVSIFAMEKNTVSYWSEQINTLLNADNFNELTDVISQVAQQT